MRTQIFGRRILLHGLMLVMVGLLWEFVVPQAPFPRLALGAHVQFMTNGLLIIVLASLLLKLPHDIGPKSAGVMLLGAWLVWPMIGLAHGALGSRQCMVGNDPDAADCGSAGGRHRGSRLAGSSGQARARSCGFGPGCCLDAAGRRIYPKACVRRFGCCEGYVGLSDKSLQPQAPDTVHRMPRWGLRAGNWLRRRSIPSPASDQPRRCRAQRDPMPGQGRHAPARAGCFGGSDGRR